MDHIHLADNAIDDFLRMWFFRSQRNGENCNRNLNYELQTQSNKLILTNHESGNSFS